MPVGIGYDIHRLIPHKEKTSIPLGGVSIPCSFRVQGHSDGDVLLHAITDACLGALALGDIGQWFPDTDRENRNRPSRDFIIKVIHEVEKLNHKIIHLDSIILLEQPNLGSHKEAIRKNIAELIHLDWHSVSVKAKTMEGLGPIGEGKAIAAYATITTEKCSP